jgi:flagellar assembly factor FliW
MLATAQRAAAPLPDHLPTDAADHALVFAEGLVGCPDWRRFVLMTAEDEDLPVGALVSLDDPAIELMVTDPRLLLPDYDLKLSVQDRASIGLTADAKPVVYCTLTLTADGVITANLLGPLVVNPTTRQGRQFVLTDSGYSTRHPVAHLSSQGGDDACSS